MRVPLNWLHEYCAPQLDAAALADRLAMTGTEVERVEKHGVTALENFVVGKVLERKRHPDADRLTVCMVDIGGSTPSQIVCGAPNVAAGQTVYIKTQGYDNTAFGTGAYALDITCGNNALPTAAAPNTQPWVKFQAAWTPIETQMRPVSR